MCFSLSCSRVDVNQDEAVWEVILRQPLRWRHNGHDGVSNHQPHDCLLNRIYGQSKHQSSASLAFVRGIHRGPVNSPHKGPVTRKMLPFDDVIMLCQIIYTQCTAVCGAPHIIHQRCDNADPVRRGSKKLVFSIYVLLSNYKWRVSVI